MQVDLILTADTVRTARGQTPIEAIGISGGMIVALGTRRDIRDWRGSRTTHVELGDSTVLPGITDCHSHPILGAELTAGTDLSGVDNLADLRETLAKRAAETTTEEWIYGWGLRPVAFEGTVPDRDLIDDATRGRACLLRMFDGHSALANSAAMLSASPREPIELGAAQLVREQSGRLTGYLRELAAIAVVADAAPRRSMSELTRNVLHALSGMARAGITSIHSLEFPPMAAAIFDELENNGPLPVRIRCLPWCQADSRPDEWAQLVELQKAGGRLWSVGGVKLFLDGTIDDGTAWLSKPDTLGRSISSTWSDPFEYTAAVRYFSARGVGTATHAIGDQAVAHVLDTVEALPRQTTAWHRIEHIETLLARDVPRFAKLGVYASMQPTHCTDYVRSDGTDNWSARVGPERALRGWPAGELDAAGAHVVLGSDWPIAGYDPRQIIAAAHLRRRAGTATEPIGREQALPIASVIAGFTSRAASSLGESAIAGRIDVGMRADLSVFALDPLRCDLDEFAESPTVATVVDGAVRHRIDSV